MAHSDSALDWFSEIRVICYIRHTHNVYTLKDFILHTQGFILYTQGFNFVHSRISCAQNFRLTELVPLLLSLYSIQWAVSSGHSQIQQDWIQGLFINIALEGESSDKSVRQPRSFIPHPAFDCREFS